MYCNKCGNKVEDDMAFCNKCGNKVAENNIGDNLKIENNIVKGQKEKKVEVWKKLIIISIIIFILTIVLKLFTNGIIWYIGNIFLIISGLLFVVGFIIGGYKMKKEKIKFPIWYMLIIGIIIAYIVIFSISKYNSYKMKKAYNNAYNEAMGNYENSSNGKIKTFEDTAAQYGMTPEELEKAIEQGLTPSDFK